MFLGKCFAGKGKLSGTAFQLAGLGMLADHSVPQIKHDDAV
jgi:hypothetical protein